MKASPFTTYGSDMNILEQKIHRYIDDQIAGVNDTISNLNLGDAQTGETPVYQASPNLIPNSHPEWSQLAFTTASTTPATAGDDNHRLYNWYYIIESATELLTTQPILATDHSGFAGLNSDAPIWDRVNGTFRLGSVTNRYNVCCPLTTNFVHPGEKFYVYFEASVSETDTDINDTEFYVGFYDNTSGQRKYIEGGDFTPTISVVGVAGSRTLEYKILARTDSGQEILSTAVTTTTAPATLTELNHVRLNFSGAPGFIQYVIYRKDGSNYYRVGDIRNSIDLQFLDIVESGSTVVPVSGYPSVTGSRPQALARTLNFSPGATGVFAAHTLTIQVPLTYDRSVTGNGMQWLRFGLTGLVASGSAREVVIRRISVSSGYGGWSRSPLDSSAASGPSSTATSAPGGGTPEGDPPPGGSGGPTCLVLDTEIDVPGGTALLKDIEKGSPILFEGETYRVKRVRLGIVQSVWEIETANGVINKCTADHRWPTTKRNRQTQFLKVGDELLDRDGIPTKIIRKTEVFPTEAERFHYGGIPVKRIWLPKPNVFIANGMRTLNLKVEDFLVF